MAEHLQTASQLITLAKQADYICDRGGPNVARC